MKKIIGFLIYFILIPCSVFAADYVIGGGDSLDISVWGNPELSLATKVRPDGKITIQALGEIKVSGLTALELTAVLNREMAKLVKTPIVTVSVTGMTNYRIFVFGKGASSGIQVLTRETTLLEFLAQLGSLANADLKNSYLLRDKKKIKTDFSGLFNKGDISQDILLAPNDKLFIPDNFDKRINIIGAVMSQTMIPYREGLTLMDAIMTAGGFTEFAKQNDVEIVRVAKYNDAEISKSKIKFQMGLVLSRNRETGRTTISVRAKDLMKGDLSKNVDLMPGDVIVVKETLF